MPTSLICVVTCARPGVDYLPQTAEVLLREGGAACDHRLVLSDGDLSHPPPGWDFDCRYPRAGIRAMMWWAFERALALDVDRLIFCEDDILPCKNAVEYMRTVEIPVAAAFVDFHDMKELPDTGPKGLHVVPALGNDRAGYWGNQCMVFPRRTLEFLSGRDPMAPAPYYEGNGILHGADIVLGRMLQRSPWPQYAAHLPRIVQHVGAVSIAHPEKELRDWRVTRGFVGVDFDAMTLVHP